MKSNNPKQIKDLGRQVKNFSEELWLQRRYSIVSKDNYAKFSQNAELRQFLISTNDRVPVEVSPYDNVWGVGMDNRFS